MRVHCLHGTTKFKPRVKSELRKQQYTETLFDCKHLAHVIVLWQMQKICVTVPFLLCFILNLRTVSKYKEGRLNGGFFALLVLGLVFGGAYLRNFTVLL